MFFLAENQFAIYWIFTVVGKALLSLIETVFLMHLDFIYVHYPVALFSI